MLFIIIYVLYITKDNKPEHLNKISNPTSISNQNGGVSRIHVKKVPRVKRNTGW